jgi:hypothetical protein
MGQGIADQVWEELSDPLAVAIDGAVDFEGCFYDAVGRRRPQLIGDLLQNRFEGTRVAVQLMPLPSRPRAKSRMSSIRSDVRVTVVRG